MSITSFRAEYAFLSNMYPCTILYEGQAFKCSEAAFQAAKTLDHQLRESFVNLDGKTAKYLGRKIILRKDWNAVRISVMKEIIHIKFSDPQLRRLLLATGDEELVEGNTWNDKFWGVCQGIGENHLGKILMAERAAIRQESTTPTATPTPTIVPKSFPILIINLHNADRYNELEDYQVIKVDRTTPVGNPFPMNTESDRDIVCDKYAEYFKQKVTNKTDIPFMKYLRQIWQAHKQGPVALACWCAPKRCHAETIRNFILSFDTPVTPPTTKFSIKEEKGDLFSYCGKMPLAHCISSDFAMGAGIAATFTAKGVKTFLQQHFGSGQVGKTYFDFEHKVYNLVTKSLYWQKPTYETLSLCLNDLKKQCLEQGVKNLAMPAIGCGLDRLEWSKVKAMICDVFKDTNIQIIVCFK